MDNNKKESSTDICNNREESQNTMSQEKSQNKEKYVVIIPFISNRGMARTLTTSGCGGRIDWQGAQEDFLG